MDLVRYKLTVSYDGTDFCGWQKQEPLARDGGGVLGPGAPAYAENTPRIESVRDGRVALRTVQGVLERAARDVCREHTIELVGASRTDSGVHARGQVAAFTSRPDGKGTGWPAERGADRLMMAINSRLPEDVVVTGAECVGETFDPIGDCTSKGYSYTFHVSPLRPLFERRTVHHLWHPSGLDARAMHEAGQRLVGEHDFAAFAAAGHGRLSTVRTVFAVSVRDVSESVGLAAGTRIRMEISGSGFLWNMVRIVGGTLMQVGLGKREPGTIDEALRTGDRTLAGVTLPPTGLCLEWVKYGDVG